MWGNRENSKKVLLIIAPENFRDEEYFYTKEELENKGIEVVTASLSRGMKKGMFGGEAIADISLDKIKIGEYGAVAFIGGSGAAIYINNPITDKIAKDTYKKGKIICAICIAPLILASSGILDRKRATVWESTDTMRIFGEHNVEFTRTLVEVDGKIVTGNGPEAARAFGRKIAELLG